MSKKPQTDLTARVEAVAARKGGDGPADRLRDAVVKELLDWRVGLVIAPVNLLEAVERYDEEAA